MAEQNYTLVRTAEDPGSPDFAFADHTHEEYEMQYDTGWINPTTIGSFADGWDNTSLQVRRIGQRILWNGMVNQSSTCDTGWVFQITDMAFMPSSTAGINTMPHAVTPTDSSADFNVGVHGLTDSNNWIGWMVIQNWTTGYPCQWQFVYAYDLGD